MPTPIDELLRRARAGERSALARAITWVEGRVPGVGDALARVPVRRREGPGSPHVLGLTGPPGAGKSSFADRLVTDARSRGERVAVVAVDPSSPFTGGAILGDRVRLEQHASDDGVYVRSLSSRGHLGGLCGAASDVVDLLDACGYDRIIVETVGVGQSEIGVIEVADTTIVVLTPESGDAVQTMKAGLLEIADVFVVNKADRPGADALIRELEVAVSLDHTSWMAPVHATSATTGVGVADVIESTRKHLAWCVGEGHQAWSRRRGDARVRRYLDLLAEHARAEGLARLSPELEAQLRTGGVSPYTAVRRDL